MITRVTAALNLAAVLRRARATSGPLSASDNPSHPVRRRGRHRRPTAPVRAATTVRAAVGRTRRATAGMFGIYNAGGRHRKHVRLHNRL